VELALLGLAIEADGVLAAEPRVDPAAVADAREVAAEHEVRARAALDALAPGREDGPSARARWHAMLATRLEAELARIRDTPRVPPWEAALPAADATGEPWARALARLRLAEALLPGEGERLRAVGLLREAFGLADGLGATPLAGAVERLARRARITLQPGAAGEGPRAAALALGLSEREVDVLALLAMGRTDREIAQELFITEKTAGHHVSHILAKLTVARRGEAAAVAHRIGLAGLDVER
jgi:DNA-binding CsgD family transcriptional regulator